jgi:hypothetical protein
MSMTATFAAALLAKKIVAGDLSNAKSDAGLSASLAFANGTGDGQASKEFSDTRTIAGSGTDNLDLSGSLTDSQGVAVVFTAIKAIVISAAAANVGNLTVGAGTNPFLWAFGDASDVLVLKPGGVIALAVPNTGWPVSAGTADILKIVNGGVVDNVYSIAVVGI